MKRLPLQTLCLWLLLQSFAWVASAQETATPPEGAAAPAPEAAPTIDTNANAAASPAPLIGPEGDPNASPAAKAAQMELVKRQELAFTATQAIADGDKLYKAGQLDAAAERYKYALDNLPEGGKASTAYQKAALGLAAVRADQGDLAYKAKNYDAALKAYQQAFELVPSSGTYRSKVANAKEKLAEYKKSSKDVRGTENNPALTPEFRDKLAEVQKLFFEGDRLYDTGQYDAAENRYMQVLGLDPYNKAARGRLERLERTRMRTADKMRETARKEAMYKVTKEWSQPIPASYTRRGVVRETAEGGESNLARMVKKLQNMRIPSLNFNQADIQTVIQVLTAKSRELDKEGINFVLKTDTSSPEAPAAPAAGGAAAAAPAPAPVAIPPVTLNLTDAPMMDVLRFISSITNLQVKVEEYAVFLLPSTDISEQLQTRSFAVPASFFEGGLKAATQPTGSTATTAVATVKIDVKQQLIDKGIQFPDGATAAFLASSSRLVVKNTPDQLDVIEALIRASDVETPQVEIETRLTEFTDDQLKALTVNYFYSMNTSLTTTGAMTNTNVSTGGYTALGEPANAAPGTFGAIVPNSLDNVLASNTTTGTGSPRNYLFPTGNTNQYLTTSNFNVIGIGGVIGGNALGVMINLIDNMKGVDLMSAPKVMAKNRTRAKIEIIRELRYPTEFERPTVSSTPFGIWYTDILGNTDQSIVYLSLPATPRQFSVKPIGVTMEVTPTTYPDQRIDLELQPEVTDFEGFINYGQAIRVRNTTDNPTSEGAVETESIVNMPVFNVRSMSTKVQVLDGQTVVLGGLIREDRQQVDDKVPFFGDLPLVGRAFRSKIEKSTKRNLMIFVTAKLVKSDGQALYNQDLVAVPKTETKGQ